MIRRPPRSTLFPTRRSSDLPCRDRRRPPDPAETAALRNRRGGRSEEHTSELQSHLNIVCRLLLEKKKPWCAPPTTPIARRMTLGARKAILISLRAAAICCAA